MESKRIREESDFVPWEYAFNNLVDTSDWDRKIKDFRAKHGISGNITWGELYLKDKNFADEFNEFLSKNQEETDRRYDENRTNLRIEKLKALDEKFMSKQSSKNKKGKIKKRTKNKDKGIVKENLDDLLNKSVENLTKRQIFKVLGQPGLESEKYESCIKRLHIINSKPVNYNKPPHIQTAKTMITKEFSGKARPVMWIPYDEIIKAKVYSIKMGIQYLKKKDESELEELLKDYQPKIQELLLKMGYEDINDIKF